MNITALRSISSENMTESSPLSGVEKKLDPVNSEHAVENANQKVNAQLDADNARELTEEMNDLMDDLQTSLGFSIHKKLDNQIVVEIKNRKTHELIRQIPTEELLSIKEKMEEFRGLILDQSV